MTVIGIDLGAIKVRASAALDAKPGKGDWTPAGIRALIDTACDVLDLIREVERLASHPAEPQRVRPASAHTGVERDTESGGVSCTECGWYLGGFGVDSAVQMRQHADAYSQRVQPSREYVEQAILDHYLGVPSPSLAAADAILALFASQPTAAEVKAEALREAEVSLEPEYHYGLLVAREFLRADRLAGGEQR